MNSHRTPSSLFVGALLTLLAGCEQRAAEPDPPPKAPTSATAALPDPTELKSEDLKVGEGERQVKKGDAIKVNYVGKLFKNGSKFDANTNKKDPFEFTVGEGVIEGWSQGVIGMKKGGKRKLTIPAKLAYGDKDQPKIPPNSALVFEIDLLGWSDEPEAAATATGAASAGASASAAPAASAAPSAAPAASAAPSAKAAASAAPKAGAK